MAVDFRRFGLRGADTPGAGGSPDRICGGYMYYQQC